VSALQDLVKRLGITGFDSDAYFASAKNVSMLPNIGIAVSGGGWRALMNGAGAIAAYDQRTPGSTGTGQLGGLLQSATYLSGLSGGGWLVSSLYANNFPTVQSIVNTDDTTSIWQFQSSIFEGPDMGNTGTSNGAAYFGEIVDQVAEKVDSGFNTTLTDFWGRALSFQLLNSTGQSGKPWNTTVFMRHSLICHSFHVLLDSDEPWIRRRRVPLANPSGR